MPTPTCTHFQSTRIPCLTCGQWMPLTLIEPGGRPNFELRTYACSRCETDESFLMAIKSVEAVDLTAAKPLPSTHF
jgi:hypothetical protein